MISTRVSSFTWKAQWGPQYHPSMFIGMAGIGLGALLATGKPFTCDGTARLC